MTLLAPLAGVLAGALGLLGLLALHALKLRRRPIRISSTLLWKDAAQDLEVNTPWRRPRMTWLLLLQALAILLLALGIARPVLGSSDAPADRIVVVIDASASMNASVGNETLFGRAIDACVARIDAMRRSDGVPEIAVVRAAHRPTLVLAPTRSVSGVRSAVQRVEPSDQPADTDALRELLGSLRSGDAGDETAPPPKVWVFTDGGSFNPNSLRGLSGEIISVAGDSVAEDARPPNTGIAALHASRDPDDPGTARVFVRLINNAERPAGVVLSLSDDDTETRVPIEIPAADESGPGSLTRTVPFPAPVATLIEARIDTGGGSLTADDAAWIDIPDPRPPRTVVFAPDGRADPFLLNVLAELAPGAVSVHDPSQTDALIGAALVVYDRVSPRSLPQIPTLGFGSVLPTDDANPNATNDRAGRERVIAWDRAHPVLRGISLSSVVFDRAVILPGEGVPGVSVLAESDRGPVITETTGQGVRHLRVAFPLVRSNWSLEVGMPIFIARAFERLAPGTRGEGVVRRTDEPIALRTTTDRVTAEGPAPFSAPASPDGTANLGPLEQAGLYRVTGATTTRVGVALLDANESALPVSASATLGSAGPSVQAAGSDRRELWPIALIAALVVMTLEYLIHAYRARI